MPKRIKTKNVGNDVTWGIERTPESPAVGELVAPVIFLWKEPGGLMAADNLSGALKHDTPVLVLRERQYDGRDWCLIRHPEQDQKGWLMATLLKERGAVELGV